MQAFCFECPLQLPSYKVCIWVICRFFIPHSNVTVTSHTLASTVVQILLYTPDNDALESPASPSEIAWIFVGVRKCSHVSSKTIDCIQTGALLIGEELEG